MSVSMAQIVIRNIDAAVVDALRQRAAATGTSMEEEARRAMTSAVDALAAGRVYGSAVKLLSGCIE
jgi:plasmid stability protein